MVINRNTSYSGYLARLHGGARLSEYLAHSPQVADFEPMRDKAGWSSFSWTPKKPIKLERVAIQDHLGTYPFLYRESQDRFLILSVHHEVVDSFLKDGKLGNFVEFPRVDVVGLVSELTEPADNAGRAYRMSAVFAALDGYGRSLRTVAFWGDDIAGASLFHTLRNDLSAYRVSIRDVRKDFDFEIASISSGGEISTLIRGISHLGHIDRMLKYINEHNFIIWGGSHDDRR